MNISFSTDETLAALAQMPFLNSIELAAVAGLPERTAREALRRLDEHGCVGMVRHARPDGFRVRRWYLTPRGIAELVKSRLVGEDPEALIVSNDLLSAQGRRYLLRRLDAAAVLYRVAQDMASALSDGDGLRLTWRWERQGGLDAVLQLPDGRTAAMSRIGSTHTGEAVGSRLRTLQNMHGRRAVRTTMLLVPGVMELERALNYAHERNICGVFVATETEVLSSPLGSRLWHTSDRDLVSSREALDGMPPSDMPRTRRPEHRRTMPSETLVADTDEQDRATTELSVPARTLLRLLHDWPLARVSQLQRMTGISEGHLGRAKGQLSRAGLVHHLRIGRTPKQRRDNETRVALGAAGLRYLSRVDRSSEQLMREQWLVEPHESEDATYRIPGFRVVGTKSRTLLRERRHTDGVYDFVSLLMASCRESRVWDLVQALPAHRWERRYRYGTRRRGRFRDIMRAVRPDATLILEHPDRPFTSFVLEFERRARNPSNIAPKIARYRTYYAAEDTRHDFPDGRPTVLFVFERREHAAGFARYAATERGRALPLLVSSLEDLQSAGSVFRSCWLHPWRLDAGYQVMRSLT